MHRCIILAQPRNSWLVNAEKFQQIKQNAQFYGSDFKSNEIRMRRNVWVYRWLRNRRIWNAGVEFQCNFTILSPIFAGDPPYTKSHGDSNRCLSPLSITVHRFIGLMGTLPQTSGWWVLAGPENETSLQKKIL